MSARLTAPHVYRAIHAISTALSKAGIAKIHMNLQDQYQYRSIDDVLGRLAPLLAKHRLCVLPRVLRRRKSFRTGEANAALVSVELLVAYDLVSSRDGSQHTVKVSAEAVDPSDKATAKAMSAAYKSAMLQTFCIPVSTGDDPDASTHPLVRRPADKQPVQGWLAWTEDIIDIIGACQTQDALDRMRSRQAGLLTAISREQAELYGRIGQAFAARSDDLAGSRTNRPTADATASEEVAPLQSTEAIDA